MSKKLDDDEIDFGHERRREFLSDYATSLEKSTSLKQDFIYSRSNLSSKELKKILYKLELDVSVINSHADDISNLVKKRNSYVHGELHRYPEENETKELKHAAIQTMKTIKKSICSAFDRKDFLKPAGASKVIER